MFNQLKKDITDQITNNIPTSGAVQSDTAALEQLLHPLDLQHPFFNRYLAALLDLESIDGFEQQGKEDLAFEEFNGQLSQLFRPSPKFQSTSLALFLGDDISDANLSSLP